MNISEVLDKIDPQEWLSTIEPYQMQTFTEMGFDKNNTEIIAQKWLNASTSYNVPFGTEKKARPFLENLKKELIKVICDDSSYQDIREKISKLPGGSPALIISTISTGIATIVGASNALIAPVLSLLLYSFGKISKNAFCATYFIKE